jgi:hypothetical protein
MVTASSQAGCFKITKRVYTRKKTVMAARIGNKMIITTIGPAFEAWRSMVGSWVAITCSSGVCREGKNRGELCRDNIVGQWSNSALGGWNGIAWTA